MGKDSFIKIANWFAMALTLAFLLCGCGHHDEPDNPDEPELPGYRPLEGLDPTVPLLNGYDKFVGYQMWSAEKIPDGDLTGEGFSYDYWAEHKQEAHSGEELMALCEVPQEQLAAMSTRNLALTCFVHPYNVTFSAYDNEYLGILSPMKANCWQELMRRETGAKQLLDLYCELTYPLSHPGTFNLYLSYLDYKALAANHYNTLNALTLAMMTAVDSNALTPEQLTVIAGEIFKKIDNILAADEGIYSYVGTIRYSYLLGAFIAYRFDRSLTPLELSLLYDLTGFIGLPGYHQTTSRYFTADDLSDALKVVEQSLERIEQGSLLTTNS